MRKSIRTAVSVLCSALLAATLPAAVFGVVRYMPDVTREMSNASYWSDKVSEPKRVLATRDEITALNQKIYKDSLETRDMAAWSKTEFDARQCVKDLLGGAKADADYLWDVCGACYRRDGSQAASKADMYDGPMALCKDPDVDIEANGTDMRAYKFAVCTTRTSLRVYPTEEAFQDDPGDPDFDYNYLTQVKVNEPVILRTRSTPLADGRFYYSALTACGAGWIPAEDVAICKDKDEWLNAWHYPSERLLVVLDDKIWTEESNSQPETAGRKLPMGTRLQLATEAEAQGQIGGRTAHNNHAVWMPVRRDDGSYEKKLALIGENRKVSEGYPELTVENVMSVALNQLGDVYGWGSMLGADDCSGYYRDVFSCFGLDLPRSTNRNNGVMKTYDLTKMDDGQKAAFIKTLPPGTNLTFSGHEMLYLGYEGDKLYVISSVYSIRMPGDDHNTKTLGTHINTLDMLRGDNQTWLHHLKEAMVPFYGADHEDWKDASPKADPTPAPAPAADPTAPKAQTSRISLSKATIRLSRSAFTYSGKVRKPAVTVRIGKRKLKAGKDYTLKYSNPKARAAGSYKVTVTGKGDYKGRKSAAYKIRKAANPLKIKGKTVTIKRRSLKKKSRTLVTAKTICSLGKGKGTVTYQLISVKKAKYRKYFSINKATGKVRVSKKLKKGTYNVKLKVKAAGDRNYRAGAKIANAVVKVV